MADYTLQIPYAVTTGTANTYTVSTTTNPTALVAGMAITVKINIAATATSTLNWNNLGAKGIKKPDGTDATNLKLNGVYTLRYDGTNFILQGEGGSGNATASDLLSGKTASTDAGDIIGTMPNNGVFNLGLGATVPAGYYSGGTAPSGKRFASGSATSSNTANTFVCADATTNGMYFLQVTGLTFTPSKIIVINPTGGDMTIYTATALNSTYPTGVVGVSNYGGKALSTSTFNFKVDGTIAQVTSTSFKLPITVSNTSYNYYAFE